MFRTCRHVLLCSLAAAGCLASQAAAAQPDPNYLKREHPHDWTLKTTVNISAYKDVSLSRDNVAPRIEYFQFDTAAVVFPILPPTASHLLFEKEISGTLTFEDQVMDTQPELLTGYPSGTRLGKWVIDQSVRGQEMQLEVTQQVRCFRTVFNEEAASQVDWPKEGWPAAAQRCLDEPEAFIEMATDGRPYDMRAVQQMLRKFTDGRSPEKARDGATPVVLAKWLAGSVMQSFQPNGNGLNFARTAKLEGFQLKGAPAAARDRRGSPFDMACLLVAIYREVGLPARLVIGYDAEAADGDREFLEDDRGESLKAWVEFALYDEDKGTLTWIPVDIVEMRSRMSRMPSNFMSLPQKYFGTHDEFDGVIPIAFQFHPPTTVRAHGSPGLWGWMVTPVAPERAWQWLDFQAMTTASRGRPRPDPEG